MGSGRQGFVGGGVAVLCGSLSDMIPFSRRGLGLCARDDDGDKLTQVRACSCALCAHQGTDTLLLSAPVSHACHLSVSHTSHLAVMCVTGHTCHHRRGGLN